MQRILALLILSVSVTQFACTKKGEIDDLAKAQACLDDVKETSPGSANSCFTYVEKYTSQQANILKCSILITSGGIMETRITQAYNIFKAPGQTSKVASFMAVLHLDLPSIDAGYDKAILADTYCVASGDSGLKFLSGLIVSGSYMNKAYSHLNIGGGNVGIDTSDPAAVNTAIQAVLAQCAGFPLPAGCTAADLPALGSTISSMAGTYCATTEADPDVCGKIAQATTAAGSDSAAVGQAILCYLNRQTYDPAQAKCI